MDTQTSFPPRLDARPRDLPPSTGTKKTPGRRWSTTVLLVLVTLIGALGGAVVVARAGDRVDVLAIARDVPAGHRLTAQDLTTVSFAKDPGLSSVAAAQRATVIGKRAAVDLRHGGLLSPAQLTPGGALGDAAQVVGVEVKRGNAPRDELRAGDKVAAVVLPAPGGTEDTGTRDKDTASVTIPATVKTIGTPDSTGALVVNLIVSPADGALLATKAAAKQIALVREPREGGS
ncbi:SAF domain-containing protein [Streptomyces sp. NBC_01571]|uniref:SAF domain-containing protein n=1 Tax=Streptomyces sp. NBC_01571 TaxID=2975883 RepID=UPI0022530540|nr:SAF domain-containing protein [Streptomyces sp. NBC_01571]MCX4581076.1 SAF domain-containing protein [Streptomyces sp. NBC_01571]